MTFRKICEGEYEVLDGHVSLGRVRKTEKRWHLRRTYVSRGWLAYDLDGEKVSRPSLESGMWPTRAEAAHALQEARDA